MLSETNEEYVVSRNACKLCTPLGASLAFKGIQGAIPLLHGSQGCSTYIRRYLISHFKEPVDVACSNFGEQTAIFGGEANLKVALDNIRCQYKPEFIGVATTCLSETIGDDVPGFIRKYLETNNPDEVPPIAQVPTPSYRGTHIDGFHGAVKAVVDVLAVQRERDTDQINIFPGMLSPADLRHLKGILSDFGAPFVMLPDYSQTLDGAPWTEYHRIPAGGTPVSDIARMGESTATLEFGRILARQNSAGKLLSQRHGRPCHSLGLPIGVNESDALFRAIELITGKPTPEKYVTERERLVDAYVDGHKYVMDARAVVYGEEDLVVGLVAFLSEIGITPVLCASGGKSGLLTETIQGVVPDHSEKGIRIMEGADFTAIEEAAQDLQPDLVIGHSKGYAMARRLNVPLVRVGFPIHDRVGGPRILHVGYGGAQQLFDRIVNTILEKRQETSAVGYSYM
ncbi:MAG: nitrogenase [Deltaproteobacteria bacterium]|nr:nitrogenase [Deltaproteobacteria bacterium]